MPCRSANVFSAAWSASVSGKRCRNTNAAALSPTATSTCGRRLWTESEALAAGNELHGGPLAGQRALDEHDLAVRLARDAAPLGVEPVDVEDQFFQSERNSVQCGRFCFSRNVRKSVVSRSYCSRVSAQRIIWKRR